MFPRPSGWRCEVRESLGAGVPSSVISGAAEWKFCVLPWHEITEGGSNGERDERIDAQRLPPVIAIG